MAETPLHRHSAEPLNPLRQPATPSTTQVAGLQRLEQQLLRLQEDVQAQTQAMLQEVRAALAALDDTAPASAPVAAEAPPPPPARSEAGSVTAIQIGSGERRTLTAENRHLPHLLDEETVAQPANQQVIPAAEERPPGEDTSNLQSRTDVPESTAETADLDRGDMEKTPTIPADEAPAAGIEPSDADLSNVDPAQLKALLKRKAAALLDTSDDTSTIESMRTRRLVLSPEELVELQRQPRGEPRDSTADGEADAASSPRTSGVNPQLSRQAEPRRVSAQPLPKLPYPAEVSLIKRLMFGLKQAVEDVVENQVIPGTSDLISSDMRDELSWYSRLILEDFLNMHERQKSRAQERFDKLLEHDPTLVDAKLVWDSEAIEEYETYRTQTYLEKFLDQLEGEVREHANPQYYLLIDYLAELFSLERLAITENETPYDPKLHELSGRQPAIPADQRHDKVVIELILSGYRDNEVDQLLRRAVVIIGEPPPDEDDIFGLDRAMGSQVVALDDDADEDEDEVWSPVMQLPDLELDSPPPLETVSPEFDLDLDDESQGEVGEAMTQASVPLPEEVRNCQQLIFALKTEVGEITRRDKLPKSGATLDDEIGELLADTMHACLRTFLILHNRSLAQAEERYDAESHQHVPHDPTPYWSPETVQTYREFRTSGFVTTFLDKLEARLNSRRLRDHQELMDHLALSMGLGRIGIDPGVTLFDPDRHELVSAANLPPNADVRAIPILAVVKSGYTDLANGRVARKAMVTVKLKGYRRPMNLQLD